MPASARTSILRRRSLVTMAVPHPNLTKSRYSAPLSTMSWKLRVGRPPSTIIVRPVALGFEALVGSSSAVGLMDRSSQCSGALQQGRWTDLVETERPEAGVGCVAPRHARRRHPVALRQCHPDDTAMGDDEHVAAMLDVCQATEEGADAPAQVLERL